MTGFHRRGHRVRFARRGWGVTRLVLPFLCACVCGCSVEREWTCSADCCRGSQLAASPTPEGLSRPGQQEANNGP
jgi:hypothetical protein